MIIVYLTPQSTIAGIASAGVTLEQDDNLLKSPSTPVARSIPRKLANDLSQVKSQTIKRRIKLIVFFYFLVSKTKKKSSFP